ncbi:hypothetical protein NHX12_008310 [Muraenolepis orangiensis]|uniref:Uncharacterized protein n=1 Tax=Muraenolepis orangiensis TaxID=630683 RepID=A0A9Q0DMS5_9TELE|nr:hypothetical protein NHX12_008310 [Muraenolepis orangiensis]
MQWARLWKGPPRPQKQLSQPRLGVTEHPEAGQPILRRLGACALLVPHHLTPNSSSCSPDMSRDVDIDNEAEKDKVKQASEACCQKILNHVSQARLEDYQRRLVLYSLKQTDNPVILELKVILVFYAKGGQGRGAMFFFYQNLDLTK